jgi:maltose alpha-D-glucosyltransferase/alpha-amylase
LAEWLRRAIAYEIYPQSFSDSGADGIGDLRGVIDRLDYLAWLGVDLLWFNPCFASPMRDAGYDVSDYLRIAPRYGTNDDLAALVEAARGHGIRVLLDLVAGHTSDEHPWFIAAADDTAADPAHDRYIFTTPGQMKAPGPQWVASPGQRPGWYLPNFFPFQPALNFGYATMNPAEPWRQPVDAPGPRANRAALTEIMAHWLGYSVAGFRVDLASTLVKDDPGLRETAGLWREIRAWLDAAFPDAVLMSEWNSPAVAVPAGFHADFYLAVGAEHRSLFDNGSAMARESSAGPDTGVNAGRAAPGACYFSAEGTGSAERFLSAWRSDVAAVGDSGLIAMFSSDHDFARPVCGDRSADQAGPVFAFLLTWPTLPGIHCGDEIGMRFVPGLPDTEGSEIWPGWNRAGSRTPMQWDDGPNAGFSAAPAGSLYLPIDPDPGRPTVAAQRAVEQSLLHQVRRLIMLRKQVPALRTGGPVQVLNAGYPLVYLREGTVLVVINPHREPASFTLPFAVGPGRPESLLASGVTVAGSEVAAGGFGYGVFRL